MVLKKKNHPARNGVAFPSVLIPTWKIPHRHNEDLLSSNKYLSGQMMCVYLSSAYWKMKFKHKGLFGYVFDLASAMRVSQDVFASPETHPTDWELPNEIASH